MTTKQPPYVETTIYVQLDPTRDRWAWREDRPDEHVIDGMRHVATTITKPAGRLRGRICVALTLRLPASVFDPLEPSAVITLDESHVIRRETVEVEAEVGDERGEEE